MTYSNRYSRSRFGGMLLAAALLGLAGSGMLRAQNFERTFGRENNEVGKAVQQTKDGGFIAAGYTQDPVTDETRAYVVRMDAAGNPLWERQFKVGGALQTFGMDLKQFNNNDHVLVGSVGTVPAAGCTSCVHIYAIRFTDNGDLIWFRSYGDQSTSQFATSVVITEIANPAPGDVGNIVIGGYSTDQAGDARGILMRVFGNGDIRWVSDYDPNPSGVPKNNKLMSVDEVRAGPGTGDIVATGFAAFPGSGFDTWVLRVNGITGAIGAPPYGSATFGTKADDRGYSIQALRFGANPGDLVIAGESYGRPGATNSEILMLQTRPDPCDPAGQRADLFDGDNSTDQNYARCVREISDSKLGRVGDVIVTGAFHAKNLGRSLDLFLQQYSEGTMLPAAILRVYGGQADDIGNGVGEVVTGPSGFIATGVTASNPPAPPGHADDLYVVRTDALMRSCTQAPIKTNSTAAKLAMKCQTTTVTSPRWLVLCSANSGPLGWQFDLCP